MWMYSTYKYNVLCLVIHCRWMKSWGIAIAGEKKMRAISAQVVGENLMAEAVPLTFHLKDGGEEILSAPMAYIPNLWKKVEDMLNESDNSITGYVPSINKINY